MKAKQCLIQFNNKSYYIGWINISDAVEGKQIKVENKIINMNGFTEAVVLKVYHKIIIDI